MYTHAWVCGCLRVCTWADVSIHMFAYHMVYIHYVYLHACLWGCEGVCVSVHVKHTEICAPCSITLL